MELGQRIRQARLEAGLSQRQLCGDAITRNMLSLIENGAARPSMDTLAYLAGRLGRPMSWFLEEQTVTSPNREAMANARRAWQERDMDALEQALEGFRAPDDVFLEEWRLLRCLCYLEKAERALAAGRLPYAAELAGRAAAQEGSYITADLIRRARLLRGMAGGPVELEDEDVPLLLRARGALDREEPGRAEEILLAAQDRNSPLWHLLMGQAQAGQEKYAAAAEHLMEAETAYPRQTVPLLERCCRELGDFKRAYEYACKGRNG